MKTTMQVINSANARMKLEGRKSAVIYIPFSPSFLAPFKITFSA